MDRIIKITSVASSRPGEAIEDYLIVNGETTVDEIFNSARPITDYQEVMLGKTSAPNTISCKYEIVFAFVR